ncbi:translation initiation factor 4E [Nitzschia inconspicua]|uniref:Translation initiation factor 4E n=1 Tax=Nitzschia inconspicua TaxID=303405 RepID=A0A9K3PQG4_9STRA|nr:translation initiation factor 4E [Nitzschia inconspicua]
MVLKPIDGTPLHSAYSFSFMRRGKSNNPKTEGDQGSPATTGTTPTTTSDPPPPEQKQETVHPYENSIKQISTVHTVEEFWETYNYLRRPNDLSYTTDYHCFREGVKPTWEDPANAKGGKWIVRLPKGLASRYWEEVVLALIGGQFPGVPEGEITGLVISIRHSEDILGIWNGNAADRDMVERLREAIKKVLLLPPHAYAAMEYKPHQNALADRSSFRNTQAWKPTSRQTTTDNQHSREKRSGSWGEREHPKPSAHGRAWR